MKKSKLRLVLSALVLFGAIALFWELGRPMPGTIPYHLQRVGELRKSTSWKWGPREQRHGSAGKSVPANATAYIHPKTWLWFLAGRPTITSHIEQQEEHQKALIRLGYFERREFTLMHRTVDAQFWPQFHLSISNSSMSDWRWFIHLDDQRPSVIRVTASKADIPLFERIVRELDLSDNATMGLSE
jgi:hypothetical protein